MMDTCDTLVNCILDRTVGTLEESADLSFECKLNGNAEVALAQIKTHEIWDKTSGHGQAAYLAGVNFAGGDGVAEGVVGGDCYSVISSSFAYL